MKLTVAQVRNYLNRLGVGLVGGETVDLRTALPLNVAGRYDAARAEIADEKCIILFPRNEEMAPGDIALHNDYVRNAISVRPVFAFSRLDREFAESLKAAKIAYVVPSRQVFLPPCAILESSRAYADDEKPLGAHLTPWAQVILLDCLLHERLPGVVWFSTLRGRLNITPVNLSRATRELERRNLTRTIRPGRDGGIEFSFDKKRIWDKASPVFVSPVRSRVRVKTKLNDAVKSGVSALAEYSDIVDNDFLTFALPASAAKKIPEAKIHRYDGDIMESWRYDPRLLNDGKDFADPLSLYISLKGATDPRIQIATERLLEKTLW